MQFDAGSCIDGRLTSAWNWGSKIEKKDYYHIFKICGFVGMHMAPPSSTSYRLHLLEGEHRSTCTCYAVQEACSC